MTRWIGKVETGKITVSQKSKSVGGKNMPSPKVTARGYWYMIKYIGLPLMGALLLLDIIFYLIFEEGLGRCYGLLCLL